MASRLDTLRSSYGRFKAGTLYKRWAKDNPGEAAKLDGYVQAVLAGKPPAAPPALATATGEGLAGFASLAVRSGLPLMMGGPA